MDQALRIEVRESLAAIDAAAWNALVGDDDPFCDYEFLSALEETGVVGRDSGWLARHVTAWRGQRLVGAIPFYLRWDSYGEYIFDFGWAEAYARAGLRYYPKSVGAVPFTPVTGSRILLAPEVSLVPREGIADDGVAAGQGIAALMVEGLQGVAGALDLSGIHVLFPRAHEHDFLVSRGFLSRITHQYHWENRDYRTFDDYLNDLRSKKRKQVLHERAEVVAQGIHVQVVTGDEVKDEHVDAIWRFYSDTAARKFSQPYLVRETFEKLATTWKRRLVLVLAREGGPTGRIVGGTFNARGKNALFGRYWGASGHYPSLHFECCYWSLIEYAIAQGMTLVEAGAQGEHKFLRGFNARPTYSAHWIAHPGGRRAIADFLEREREHSGATIEGYNRVSPVKSERSRF